MALKGTVNIVFSSTVRLGFVLKRELNDQDMYTMYIGIFMSLSTKWDEYQICSKKFIQVSTILAKKRVYAAAKVSRNSPECE